MLFSRRIVLRKFMLSLRMTTNLEIMKYSKNLLIVKIVMQPMQISLKSSLNFLYIIFMAKKRCKIYVFFTEEE